MAIDLGAHKPTIKLIRQFVGEDENGREFSYSRYTIKALCSACNKPIDRGFWAVIVNGARGYYHSQCIKIEQTRIGHRSCAARQRGDSSG